MKGAAVAVGFHVRYARQLLHIYNDHGPATRAPDTPPVVERDAVDTTVVDQGGRAPRLW